MSPEKYPDFDHDQMPSAPDDFSECTISRFATKEDGVQLAEQIAQAEYDKLAKSFYAAADYDHDDKTAQHLERRLNCNRHLVEQLESSGRHKIVDESQLSHVPWSPWERITCIALKLVGIIAMGAVLNTLASVCIASGANTVWVMHPWTAVLFVFAGLALVVGLDAAVSTFTPRMQSLLFFLVTSGAIGTFAWWLYEIGTLVNAANRSLAELVRLAADGLRRTGIGPRLVWSQVTLETLSGLLCWMTNARISARHVVKGVTDNSIYLCALELIEQLEPKLEALNCCITRSKEKIARLDAQRDAFVKTQADRVRARKEEARIAARLRDSTDQQNAYLLHQTHLNGSSIIGPSAITCERPKQGPTDRPPND